MDPTLKRFLTDELSAEDAFKAYLATHPIPPEKEKRAGLRPTSSPFWARDVRAIIRALEADIRRGERRRYGGLDPETLSLEEVGAALWVSDRLKEQGILEVTPERMRELLNDALRRGLGYGVGGEADD